MRRKLYGSQLVIAGKKSRGRVRGGAITEKALIDVGFKVQHNFAFASWVSTGMVYFSPRCKNVETKEIGILSKHGRG